MIQIKDLHLQFGEQLIFDSISCTINKNQKIGLIGRNGTGKSTLLKIIAQQMQWDNGTIEIQKNMQIAYMSQEVVITSTRNVLDETLAALPDLFKLYNQKKELETIIHNNPTQQQINLYAEVEHELIELNFDAVKVQAQKMLTGLGVDETKQNQSVNELSVGWRMRVVLAKLLLQKADFYLFDEPTNHLDLSAKNWFLNFLKESSFGYILVCHDRYFLDKACDVTFELSLGKLTLYHGNYSYYKEQKAIRSEQLKRAYKKQQKEIKQKEQTIEQFRSKSSKAKMVQSMIKALDRMEKIKPENQQNTITLQFKATKQSGMLVLKVHNLSYIFDHPLFKKVSFEVNREDRVALIAPNGTGKTTLFNLIAKKLELQKGSIEFGHNVSKALFDQDQEKILDPEKTILQEVADNIDATDLEIRSTLGALLFNQDDIQKPCKVLSGGERNRVAMAKVALSKSNFLLLDEPTNHLDIESKEIILKALKDFKGSILFVSHDQDFVNRLATKIIELDQTGATLYLGNYNDYLDTKKYGQLTERNSSISIKKTIKNNKDLFELQKKCKNLENKITHLEEKLQVVLTQLSIVQYGTPKYQELEQEHINLQKKIETETEKWEKILHKIDKGDE